MSGALREWTHCAPRNPGQTLAGPGKAHSPNSSASRNRLSCSQRSRVSGMQHDRPSPPHAETHAGGAELPNLELCPGSPGGRQAGCLASEVSRASSGAHY